MEVDAWLEGPPRPTSVTRLVTFNVRNGRAPALRHTWWGRREAVLASLVRLAPDLAGLQEPYAFQADWLCRRLPAYGRYGVGRTDGARRGEQALVLYRLDRYRLLHAETRWYGDEPATPGQRLPGARFPRTAAILHLEDTTDGSTLGFVNTHLHAHERANRLRATTQLAAWVAGSAVPTALVGDLNDEPAGPALRVLVEEGGLRHAVPGAAGGSNHDFTGTRHGRRLDHILVPPSWTVAAAGVDHRRVADRLASDHWPVVADVFTSP